MLSGQPGTTSSKSLSDHVMYAIMHGGNIKLLIVEVKTDLELSKDSIAQTVGYYISSNVAHGCACIPMALLVTQSKAQLIFFPFLMRDGVCINAVVTELLDITKMDTFFAVAAFISRYIMAKPKGVSTTCTRLRSKKAYNTLLISFEDYKRTKDEKIMEKLKDSQAELCRVREERAEERARYEKERAEERARHEKEQKKEQNLKKCIKHNLKKKN